MRGITILAIVFMGLWIPLYCKISHMNNVKKFKSNPEFEVMGFVARGSIEALNEGGFIRTPDPKEDGNTNFQTEGGETNMDTRREESLTAVMLSARECELTDELGNLYGLSLDSEESNEGSITCKPGGTFIGPVNATVFVSGKYGKSQVKGAYSVNSKGQMFVYHTLPEITSVSPNIQAIPKGEVDIGEGRRRGR